MDVLYITYDGLTDFIGQSQVLPYLAGTAVDGHRLTVISFEKVERYQRIGRRVGEQCGEWKIRWLPQTFHSFPPYIAKIRDMRSMRRVMLSANVRDQFDLLHCRSYPAALAGLQAKRQFGIPLLFDMRGFWPDQRREGGRWRNDSVTGRWLYARWKRHEAELIAASDHIVVLTGAAKRELEAWPAYRGAPISVIPCCADFEHFTVKDPADRALARKKLGICEDATVLAYLGSIGTVYRIADHLRLFAALKRRDPFAKALFIGPNTVGDILAVANAHNILLSPADVVTICSEREDVPFWLGAADVGSCLIVPTYSSIGVSPTKLAEYLACGVPVIANCGVGDVEATLNQIAGGLILRGFDDVSIESAAEAIPSLRSGKRSLLHSRARLYLDLNSAIAAYARIYGDLEVATSVRDR